MIPKGIIPPVLTPLTKQCCVDEQALRRILDNSIAGGVDAVFVAGTCGFGSVLTATEYERLIRATLDQVGGRVPVLVGVLESSTARVIERIQMIERSGVSAVVLVAPFYLIAVSDRQVLRHFEAIRESTELEMVVYNIPGCVGMNIPVPTILEMAKRKWISACKDSSGNEAYFATLCRGGTEAGLSVYQGLRPVFAELASLGAAGCVPVPANVYPECFAQAWKNREVPDRLADLQKQCDRAWSELVAGTDYFSRSLRHLAEVGIGTGAMPEPFNVQGDRGGNRCY